VTFLSKISKLKRSIVIIILVLILAITFETFQQLYYIKRYQIADNISFFHLLKDQAISWLVWIIVSGILVWYTKQISYKKKLSSIDISKHITFIFGLVFLNIIIISFIRIFRSPQGFDIDLFLNEFIPFFAFQKAPIYTLGYIAIAIILYLHFINEKLLIEVQQLIDIKKVNANLYNQLKQGIDDKTPILNIKIGNNRKIIPIEHIQWIEADDYCVKVHTINNTNYTMRSTLKALNNKLSNNFLRVHRKAIVNMDMAKELNLSNLPKLILNNNTEIPVSKSNLKKVKNFLN
jgi:heme/copper-type cytochrome/quinol oxidase subunit 3